MSRWLKAAAVVGAYAAVAEALRRRHAPREDGVLHEVETEDHWRLAVREYAPSGPAKGAVYLQHGLGSTARIWDLAPHGPSLARWLAKRGWRVFAGNLRGRAPSEKRRHFRFDLSDYVLRDIPAIGRFVHERAGGKFHYIGHSLGGILGLAHAAGAGAGQFRSLTTLGSALHYGVGGSLFERAPLALRAVLRMLPRVPMKLWHRLAAPLAAARLAPDVMQYNRANVDAAAVLAFHMHSVTDMSIGELLELSSTLDGEGIEVRALGRRLPEMCREITVPWFSVVGERDVQCPPETARWTYTRVQAPDKRWLKAKAGAHFLRDYGHCDFLIGSRAERELWPRLEKFLESAQVRA